MAPLSALLRPRPEGGDAGGPLCNTCLAAGPVSGPMLGSQGALSPKTVPNSPYKARSARNLLPPATSTAPHTPPRSSAYSTGAEGLPVAEQKQQQGPGAASGSGGGRGGSGGYTDSMKGDSVLSWERNRNGGGATAAAAGDPPVAVQLNPLFGARSPVIAPAAPEPMSAEASALRPTGRHARPGVPALLLGALSRPVPRSIGWLGWVGLPNPYQQISATSHAQRANEALRAHAGMTAAGCVFLSP